MKSLGRVVKSAATVLLDFDGPVCQLFSSYPAADIADQIRTVLLDSGAHLPKTLHDESDPLQLLRWTGQRMPHLLGRVEEIQATAELAAAESAVPTTDSAEMITAAVRSGRPVLVVSNNSEQAIVRHLKSRQLMSSVTAIIGRETGRPGRLKPDPYLVLKAIALADASPSSNVLIGDSASDIQAARQAGTSSIGYAKDASRISDLVSSGADVVVDNMAILAKAFSDFRPEPQ